jgi:hypothetical protein
MRDADDLNKEFPDSTEVSAFTATLIPLLAQAMHLRSQQIPDLGYYLGVISQRFSVFSRRLVADN